MLFVYFLNTIMVEIIIRIIPMVNAIIAKKFHDCAGKRYIDAAKKTNPKVYKTIVAADL